MRTTTTAFLLLCLISCSLAQNNQAILQQVFNGFYEADGLADPTTIIGCIDSADAATIVNFLPTFFKKASSSLTILSAVSSITNLVASLNPDTLTCLSTNAEVLSLSTVYDVSGIDPSAIAAYIPAHFALFTTEFSTLSKLWAAGSYSAVGASSATFAQTVIKALSGNSSLLYAIDSNQATLQQFFNGFYTADGLADPTTIIGCIDSADAATIVNFLPTFFKKASSSLTILSAVSSITNLVASLNPDTLTCLSTNAEVLSLSTVYDVSGIDPSSIVAYIPAHFALFTNEFQSLSKLWAAGSYSAAGASSATFAQTVIQGLSGNSSLLLATDANQAILQQFFNGFYTADGLADPTTIIGCIDSADAATIVNFLPTFFKKASSSLTILSAVSSITNLVASLNPDTLTCLSTNAEVLSLSTVYDVAGIDPSSIISYIPSHFALFTNEFQSLSKLWAAGSYSAAGASGAVFAGQIIDALKPTSNLALSNLETMQEFYNGFYNQQNLANPTYINECYNDETASEFNAQAATFLKKASSVLTIQAAFNGLQAYTTNQNITHPEITECLSKQKDLPALYAALNISTAQSLNDKLNAYILANLSSTTGEFSAAYKNWGKSAYSTSGSQVSAWFKKANA